MSNLTSEVRPYTKYWPSLDYSFEEAKKTAFDFILYSAKIHFKNYENLRALNFYGRKINNGEFFKQAVKAGKAFKILGLNEDDVVPMFCLNVPETFYSMYGLNMFGLTSEWFNAQGMTASMLREHILENNYKVLVIIDIFYPIVKEAIKGTNVEKVIVTSVQDSFPFRVNLLYTTQVFGLSYIANNPYYKHILREIGGVDNIREIENLPVKEQKQVLTFYQKEFQKLDEYIKKEKILAKSSFYRDENRDERFILWNDFIRLGDKAEFKKVSYEEDKASFIVHTGGTTGPAKSIEMTDFAINSAVMQAYYMLRNVEFGDTFCQLVPPIVAWSLEGFHFARYFGMETHMIATYDRNEFPKIVLKTRANHYFTVPSFVNTLVDSPLMLGKKLPFIKTINHGGESLWSFRDRKIDKFLQEHGADIQNQFGFGQNEEFGAFTVNIDIPGEPKDYGSCGVPFIGNDYIILDHETKEELPFGKNADGEYYIGDLYVTGPTIMKGYTGKAKKENETTIYYYKGKKYIRTGDQAYIDENGKLWYVTREERIIRTQEGKVFVNVIEDILNEIPEIAECCVVKSPHPTKVAEVSCHIVLIPNLENVDEIIKKIIDIVEKKTSSMYTYYVPGTYKFVPSLPHTTFGKIDFRKLEAENEAQFDMNGGKALKRIRKNI